MSTKETKVTYKEALLERYMGFYQDCLTIVSQAQGCQDIIFPEGDPIWEHFQLRQADFLLDKFKIAFSDFQRRLNAIDHHRLEEQDAEVIGDNNL